MNNALSIHFIGRLGTAISVAVEKPEHILDALRDYGRAGWTSGDIPAGGLQLPYCMADTFDWSLIGARQITVKDDDGTDIPAVVYRSDVYKRRVHPENKKMPAAIRYTRGARSTDPPHLKEGDGQFQYITLVEFRGKGRPIARYERTTNTNVA